MNRFTLEDFYNDPDFYRRVNQAAQRERTLAIRAGLAWIRERAADLMPRAQPLTGRRVARLG